MVENTSHNSRVFGSPIPTKFLSPEEKTLSEAMKRTGLSRSEIIRRSVRLVERQSRLVNGYAFLIDLTA